MSDGNPLIDPLDWEIIEQLRQSGRMSNSAIARELNVTEGTVRHRIKKLKESGVLKISGMVNPHYIDKDQLVLLGLNITESRELRKAFEKVRQLPEVRSTSITSGRFDLTVVVVVDGNRGLINFLTGSISTVKEIVSSESFVLLKTDNYWL